MLASAANGLDTPLGTTTAPRACPAGTVLDASDGQCAYHVGLIFPYGEFLSKAVRVVGAYLAIEHINSRNATVVPDAAVLPPGFKVMGPLTSADAVEGRLFPLHCCMHAAAAAPCTRAGEPGLPFTPSWLQLV